MEPKRKEIDGFKYVLYPLGAIAANQLLIKLVSKLGHGLVALLAGADDDMIDGLRHAASGMLAELTPTVAEDLLLSAMAGLQCEGVGAVAEKTRFDDHFRGRLFSAYKVWVWCIEVNFQDFFAVAQPRIIEALGPLKADIAGSATSTPTPTSGDSAALAKGST